MSRASSGWRDRSVRLCLAPVFTPRTVATVNSKVVLALVTVYVVWGSTYLGLRFALESFPPFLLGGARYTLAGLLLYGWARQRGEPAPTRAEWSSASLLGVLFFVLGNGLVAVAEQSIDSGVAAVVVATTTLWSVLFAAFRGVRPRAAELLGVALGLAGIALLSRGGAFAGSVGGFVAITIAPMAWALGTVWSASLRLPAGMMASAIEMIAGGLQMALLGLFLGERVSGPPSSLALFSFVYLTLFGSLIAFSAFGYLLRHTRPSVATSCAFVNPIVALLLGSLLGDEQLSVHHWLACGLSVFAVLCVLRARTTAS